MDLKARQAGFDWFCFLFVCFKQFIHCSSAEIISEPFSRTEYLNQHSTDIGDWLILCCRGCPVHSRMSSGISGLYPLVPVTPVSAVVVKARYVCRPWQMSTGADSPLVRTSGPEKEVPGPTWYYFQSAGLPEWNSFDAQLVSFVTEAWAVENRLKRQPEDVRLAMQKEFPA